MPDGTATAHLLRPKLLTTLSEGYDFPKFQRDFVAGLTVAVVALPLSMAIAVASGVSPERGLYASIVGGFLVSALGGSRFQIGGPAGAFILLVAAAVTKFGIEGVVTAMLLSGVMLTLLGLSRLGSLIRHIPHAVTVGFTCAIAMIIFSSQLKDFGGIRLESPEPGPLFPKLMALGSHLHTLNPVAVGLGISVAVIVMIVRKYKPLWPGMLIAVALASGASVLLHLPVETIGARFGDIPRGMPHPVLPNLQWDYVVKILPTAFSFTLLGAVESLLSAKIADGMSSRKHRSNMELVAQGIANVATSFFGGICVTGTIARTATNVRAGAVSPVSGMLHAVFVLIFVVAAAQLAAFVPLSALAGLLTVVAWNMAEKEEFVRLMRDWRSATVLLATFGVTIFSDLTKGIAAGCILAAIFAATKRPVAEEGE